MATKPSEYLDWNPSQSNVIEPPSGKKSEGWIAEEPPADYMNWLFYMSDQWIKWFDFEDGVIQAEIDLINDKIGLIYQAIVSSVAGGTHATLAAALADATVFAGATILIKDNFTVNTAIAVTKANIKLEFAPGVTYTSGSSSTCFHVQAAGFRCQGGRFQGFSTTAFLFDSGSDYGFVALNRFKTCTDQVTDNTSTGNIQSLGNTTEA